MANLSDFEEILPALPRGEKAQILKWVIRELDGDFPGIDARPDVCGGEPCVVRTRTPIRRLDHALLAAYPICVPRSRRNGPFLYEQEYSRACCRGTDHAGIVLVPFDRDFCRQAQGNQARERKGTSDAHYQIPGGDYRGLPRLLRRAAVAAASVHTEYRLRRGCR